MSVFYFHLKEFSVLRYTHSAHRLICTFKHKLLVKQQKTTPRHIIYLNGTVLDVRYEGKFVSCQPNGLPSCSFSTPLNDLLQWR